MEGVEAKALALMGWGRGLAGPFRLDQPFNIIVIGCPAVHQRA